MATRKKAKKKAPKKQNPPAATVVAQVEQLELVQRALELLDEAERRAAGLRDDATREVRTAVEALRVGAQSLRSRVGQAEEEAIAKAKQSVDGFLARFSERTTREVDTFLERVGLMRKERHDEAVAAIKKTGKKTKAKKTGAKKTAKKKPKKKAAKKAAKKAPGKKKSTTKKG
jgi:hypothetical protein